jgi:hypothetical protein
MIKMRGYLGLFFDGVLCLTWGGYPDALATMSRAMRVDQTRSLLGIGLLWPGLARNLAASRAFPGRWPPATRPSFCVGPIPPESRQKLRQELAVDTLRQL